MNYTFKGRLCGYLCDQCSEPLAKVKVRLYRLRPEQDATRLAVAEPKDTFAVLSVDQLRAKENALLGEFETDGAGNFTAELGKGRGRGVRGRCLLRHRATPASGTAAEGTSAVHHHYRAATVA